MEHLVKSEKSSPNRHQSQRESESRPSTASHAGMQLQQQAGNQAMQQLLRSGFIRPKLSVSQPGDPEEQEADAVAHRIMRSPAGAVAAASSCSCGGHEDEMCDECRQKASIARKSSSPGASVSSGAAQHMLKSIHSSHGHPLDGASRSFFEPRFGRDFSSVRVHTDATAASSARAIQALAFSTGRDIFFASGQYSPHTDSGRTLLAHELTHTLQKHPDLPASNHTSASAVLHRRDTVLDPQNEPPADIPLPQQDSPASKISRQGGGDGDAGAPTPPTSAGSDRDLDAGVPGTPGTGATPDHFDFEGLPLTPDTDQNTRNLEGYVEDHGLEACEAILPRFEAALQRLRFENSPEFLSDVSGVPDWIETNRRHLAQMEESAPSFRTAHANVVRESHEFLTAFDVQAHAVLTEMLNASEDRILSERERYGLTMTTTERTRRRHDEGGSYSETEVVAHYGMGNNAATRGLAGQANNLASKVRSIRHLMDVRNGLRPVSFSENSVPTEEEMRPYREADSRVQAAVREYNTMRFTAEADYPILAAYTPLDTSGTFYVDQTIERLSAVGRGSSSQLGQKLYDETADKLANIDHVFQAVASGELKVWKLPSVVSLTSQRMEMLPILLQDRLVTDKVRATEQEGEILNTALAVLAVALGALAAIPTGGASLAAGVAVAAGVGSAALGVYFAAEHIQQYALEAAANGTDFDKARAVSQVEPSLFWLAVDIIGALGGAAADIHAAASTFRALSASLREAAELRQLASQGQRVAEADARMARLAQEGDAVAPGLGRKLTEAVGREGTAVEKNASIAAWESSLSPQSRAFLVDNPEIRAIYTEMDDQLRWLCTHCSDNCLIQGISRAQVSRIRTVMQRLNPEDLERLRIYLHVRKAEVGRAIADLERIADSDGLRALMERTLTERANPPTAPLLTGGAATTARNSAGAAVGGEYLPVAGQTWLSSTGGSAGMVPGQIAARLRGRAFSNFSEFQQAFWREVAADPQLVAGFGPKNRAVMAAGGAPFVVQEERWGRSAGGRFILHHILPIEHGGGVYDMSNLLVTSPRLHFGTIHSPTVPGAGFRQLPIPED